MDVNASIGARQSVFNPSTTDEEWYLNDHTLVQGPDGLWHLFGITAPEPARPLEEVFFAHATAPTVTGPWTAHEPVMHADTSVGETHVWAPHVIAHDGTFWMFYTGGTDDHTRYRIQLATSDDLFTWRFEATLFEDGYDARDPMVLRVGEQWVLYYTRTSAPEGGVHQVAARTSDDLRTWSEPRVVFDSRESGTYGGPTESPFVIPVSNGSEQGYLLSVCDAFLYDVTRVYFSTDPFHWEGEPAFIVSEHCPEYVADGDRLWVTGAGWGRGGLHVRPMRLEAR